MRSLHAGLEVLDQLLKELDDDHFRALRWLPADGSPKDRGTVMNVPVAKEAVLRSMAPVMVGNPRTEVAIMAHLCEPVPEMNAPREFDDYWRLTPLGVEIVSTLPADPDDA